MSPHLATMRPAADHSAAAGTNASPVVAGRNAASKKGYRRGTHRLVAPEITVQRAQRLMPQLGITRVANVTGLDTTGVPVVMVTRPNAKSLSVAQGKGASLTAAIASGLMEAIESYHAETITLPLKLASWAELRAEQHLLVQDFDGLPHYPGKRLDIHQRLLWIEARSLTAGRARWLPYDLVHTDFTLPLPSGSGTFFMSSGGLASGNHLLEALSHGLCELIERDAATLWHCRDAAFQACSRIDLNSIDDQLCREVLDRYEQANLAVLIWDITSDIGIAAFKCTIFDRSLNPLRPIGPMGGMGCHPVREVALLRALTEAAQSRTTLIAGARDDMVFQRLDAAACGKALARMAARQASAGPLRSVNEVPSRAHDSFDEDIAYLLERLAAAGLHEALFVDLTKPDLGVPVVRVIVPALELLAELPGYQPGRRARAALATREAR